MYVSSVVNDRRCDRGPTCGTFSDSQTDALSTHWIAGGILRAAVNRPATVRGRPRGVSVQSLILLDIRTVVCAALLIAPSEVVLAQNAAVDGSSTKIAASCALSIPTPDARADQHVPYYRNSASCASVGEIQR